MASQPSQYTYPSISPPAVDLTTQHTMNSNDLSGGNQYDNQPQHLPLNSAIAYDNIFDQYLDSSALYGSNNDQQYQPEDTFERFLRDFPMSSQQDDDQVPWNGQMSSLQPPEALQPNILEAQQPTVPEAQQPQYDPISVASPDQHIYNGYIVPLGFQFPAPSQVEGQGGAYGWDGQMDLQTQPSYGQTSHPSSLGYESQGDFSVNPQDSYQDPQQFSHYHPSSSHSPAPNSFAPPLTSAPTSELRAQNSSLPPQPIPKKGRNASMKSQSEVAASSMPPPPAPSAPRNGSELPSIGSKKGKARAVPKRSQAVASSSSMPPPPVPDRPNKRGREVENGGEPMPTKRAMKTAPVESSDSLRRFDPFCQKLLGVECNCRDCFKAVGTAHFYYVQSLISYFRLHRNSITQQIHAGAEMLLKVDGITVRHVWTLDALLPHMQNFELFFHPNNCFVSDTMTRASYWWPNYNLTPPAKWPGRFVAIPCPFELVLHWSTLYIGWAYQIGIVLSVTAVVGHLTALGNIPAAIPAVLHTIRSDARIINPILSLHDPVLSEATNNSHHAGDGRIVSAYSQQRPTGFGIALPRLLGHGNGATGGEATLRVPVPGANPMEPAAWMVAPQSSVDNGYGATSSAL